MFTIGFSTDITQLTVLIKMEGSQPAISHPLEPGENAYAAEPAEEEQQAHAPEEVNVEEAGNPPVSDLTRESSMALCDLEKANLHKEANLVRRLEAHKEIDNKESDLVCECCGMST
jgi:hypothetical protein